LEASDADGYSSDLIRNRRRPAFESVRRGNANRPLTSLGWIKLGGFGQRWLFNSLKRAFDATPLFVDYGPPERLRTPGRTVEHER